MISFDTRAPQPGQTTPRNLELWLLGLTPAGTISYAKLGSSNSTSQNYWSTARASMSMDGTLVVYDSDQGAGHAVYSLATGQPPVQRR